MARLPRLVLPGYPYHVTQRGNRRQRVFLGDADYVLYRDLLAEAARRAGAQIWAYCLMPNHVHVIVVPSDEDGLRRTFADAHRNYGSELRFQFTKSTKLEPVRRRAWLAWAIAAPWLVSLAWCCPAIRIT